MLLTSFSFLNLAEWTPMTTSSFGYFASRFLRSGMMCMQLMQQYVQKSSRTILPLRSFFKDSGLSVFSHWSVAGKSGALMRGSSCMVRDTSVGLEETQGRAADADRRNEQAARTAHTAPRLSTTFQIRI